MKSFQVPSDSPRAIEILLHIIHLNTRQVPRAGDVEVDELFQVAHAVDIYDLGGCLGLWAKNWCSAVAPIVRATSDVTKLVRLSWIAWVFGDELLFRSVLHPLVVELQVDEDGELFEGVGMEIGDLDVITAMDLLGKSSTRSGFFSHSISVTVRASKSDPDMLTINRPPSHHSHWTHCLPPLCSRIHHSECCQQPQSRQTLPFLSKYDSVRATFRLSTPQSPRGLYQRHAWLTISVPSSRKSVSLPQRP